MSEKTQKKKQGNKIPRLSEKKLKEFVLSYCNGHIFTSEDFRTKFDLSQLLPMVFMPLALGGLDGVNPKDVGVIWEERTKAGPRSVNGYPMFFSCHFMHFEDWKIASRAIKKELKRRESIEL